MTELSYDLNGRRALVTGSSRGIGSAIALELARAGADVIVHCATNVAKGKEVCDQILAMGRKCEVIAEDLCDPEGAARLAEKAGNVDILVLNASLQIQKPWQEITPEDFQKQAICNYYSSFVLMQKLAPYMKAQKWGRIIAIGSVQEAKPHPEMLIYSSSKCAQTGLTRSLANMLAADGVTVNSVAPGVINTDRNTKALSDPVYAPKVAATIPVGFWGEMEDMAGIVRVLASDYGRYITGQNIYVDGGKSL